MDGNLKNGRPPFDSAGLRQNLQIFGTSHQAWVIRVLARGSLGCRVQIHTGGVLIPVEAGVPPRLTIPTWSKWFNHGGCCSRARVLGQVSDSSTAAILSSRSPSVAKVVVVQNLAGQLISNGLWECPSKNVIQQLSKFGLAMIVTRCYQ